MHTIHSAVKKQNKRVTHRKERKRIERKEKKKEKEERVIFKNFNNIEMDYFRLVKYQIIIFTVRDDF